MTIHSTPTAATVDSNIKAPKRTKLRPLAWKARRLVRFETGSRSEAELARCAQA
jgi:hypothetical protein